MLPSSHRVAIFEAYAGGLLAKDVFAGCSTARAPHDAAGSAPRSPPRCVRVGKELLIVAVGGHRMRHFGGGGFNRSSAMFAKRGDLATWGFLEALEYA